MGEKFVNIINRSRQELLSGHWMQWNQSEIVKIVLEVLKEFCHFLQCVNDSFKKKWHLSFKNLKLPISFIKEAEEKAPCCLAEEGEIEKYAKQREELLKIVYEAFEEEDCGKIVLKKKVKEEWFTEQISQKMQKEKLKYPQVLEYLNFDPFSKKVLDALNDNQEEMFMVSLLFERLGGIEEE